MGIKKLYLAFCDRCHVEAHELDDNGEYIYVFDTSPQEAVDVAVSIGFVEGRALLLCPTCARTG